MKRLLIILILLPLCLRAQEKWFCSDIRYGKLENGLTYYILKNPEAQGYVNMWLVNSAGEAHEDEDQIGLAHLVEHSGFRSTEHFPGGLMKGLTSIGLQSGNAINGSTGIEAVHYLVTVPSGDQPKFDSALLALHDWAGGITLIPSQVDEERGIVVRELLENEIEAQQVMREGFYQLSGRNPSYLNTNPKAIDNVRTAPFETINRFYKEWYRPNREAVLIVGDIDPAKVEQMVRERFSDLKNQYPEPTRVIDFKKPYELSLPEKNRLIVVNSGSAESLGVNMYLRRPAEKRTVVMNDSIHKAHVRSRLLDEIYDAMMRSRLEQLKIDGIKNHFHRNIYNHFSSVDAIESDIYSVSVDRLKETIAKMTIEFERVRRYGFSEVELVAAKQIISDNLKYSTMSNASLLSMMMEDFLDPLRSPINANETELRQTVLDNVTVNEINYHVKSWIDFKRNVDVLISSPSKDLSALPSEVQMFSWINEASKQNIAPYEAKKFLALPVFDKYKSDVVLKREDLKDLGITKLTLKNGVEVVLKPLKRYGQVRPYVSLVVHGFNTSRGYDVGNDSAIAEMLGSISMYTYIDQMSSGDFRRWQQERTERGYLGLDLEVNSREASIKGESANCTQQDLEDILNLIRLRFQPAGKDRGGLQAWKDIKHKQVGEVKNRETAYYDSIHSGAGVSKKMIAADLFTKERLEKAYNIYKDRFSDASGFTFLVTGFFDTDSIIGTVEKYLGSIPGKPSKKNKVSPPKINVVVKNTHKDLPRHVTMYDDSTGNGKVNLIVPIYCDVTPESDLKLRVLENLFQRLTFIRLREKEQGTYSPQLFLSSGTKGRYTFNITFETKPEDIDRLVTATREEIMKVMSGDIENDLLDGAKARVYDHAEFELHEPLFWDRTLHKDLGNGMISNSILNYASQVKSFTKEDIIRAARTIQIDKLMIFELL